MQRRFVYGAVALTLALACASAHAGDRATQVAGAGSADVTDPDGNTYPSAFALAGTVRPNGSARGAIEFLFSPAFSAVWGAVPGVDLIYLNGTITGGSVGTDGSVTLTGTLTEIDLSLTDGVVFQEEDVPFEIVIGGPQGRTTFSFQWCELPTFYLEVTNGSLIVR